MQEIVDRALAQMEMIEQIYSLKILNKKEIADLIAENTDNKREVLMICTRLNTWIAASGAGEDLTVPKDVGLSLIKEGIEAPPLGSVTSAAKKSGN
jgi:hypothetical protein